MRIVPRVIYALHKSQSGQTKAAKQREAIYDTQHNRPLIMLVMAAMTKK
jgi:hypothetical protein